MEESNHSFVVGVTENEIHVFAATEKEVKIVLEVVRSVDEWYRTIAKTKLDRYQRPVWYLALELSDHEVARDFRIRFSDWCQDRERAILFVPGVHSFAEIERQVAGAIGVN